MKQSKAVRTRLVGSILLALALGVVLPAWYYRTVISEELLEHARYDAARVASMTKSLLQSKAGITNRLELNGVLVALGKEQSLTFSVTQPAGAGSASQGDTPAAAAQSRLKNQADEVVVKDLMQSGQVAVSTPLSLSFSPAPLLLHISIPMPDLQKKILRLRSYAIFAFLASFCCILGFTLIPIRRLDNSMSEIIRVADDIGRGDFKKRALLYSNKDFPALSCSIRRMAERIEAHIFVITEQNNQLEAILDSMNEGVMVLDSSCRILTINKAMGRIIRHANKYIGRRPLEMMDSPELQKACDAIISGQKEEKNCVTTMQIEPVKDTVYDVTIACLREKDQDTGEAAAIAVFHDISALKSLERVRSDFVANVSHELRTPLTSIKGYAETILASIPDDEKSTSLHSFLEIILRNANHMTKIVNELLSLARLEGGNKSGRNEPIDAASALNQAYKECAHLDGAQNIVFDNKLPLNSVIVAANFDGLVQVFRNLLENAFKYGASQADGTGRITIWHERKENGYIFAVKDNGPGIPRDKRERIFERFYRIDKHRSRNSGSSGLGLAIAKHIVEQMKGAIWVETSPESGTGAVFYFSLPLALPSEPPLQQESVGISF